MLAADATRTGSPRFRADRLRDRAHGHALLGDRVHDRHAAFERQPEDARGVGAVHGGPAVGPVAHVAGDAPVARDGDQHGDEPRVARAVDGRRQAHDRRADPARRQGERRLRVDGARMRPAAGSSSSVPTRPGASPRIPEAITSGLPESSPPRVSIACRSVPAASSMRVKSWT